MNIPHYLAKQILSELALVGILPTQDDIYKLAEDAGLIGPGATLTPSGDAILDACVDKCKSCLESYLGG